MENKKNQIKRIRDLNYAALLKSEGYELEDIEWNYNIAYWLFKDRNGEIDALIQRFINGRITGNLKKFTEEQKTLKGMLHNN